MVLSHYSIMDRVSFLVSFCLAVCSAMAVFLISKGQRQSLSLEDWVWALGVSVLWMALLILDILIDSINV